MSYKLEYPYTEQERLDFIVQYNHQQGLRIETVDNLVEEQVITEFEEPVDMVETKLVNYPTHYALEANEIMENGEPVINPNYEAEQAQKERERIAKLFLTGADVERGIYQAIGKDFEDIVEMVTQLQPEGLDIKALKIELKANNFYRGNPYVSAIGGLLGFTIGQLDKFFETNDYTVLLPVEEPEMEIIEEPDVNNSETVEEENSENTDV